MIIHNFMAIFSSGVILGAVAIYLLAYGIYAAITDKDIDFCIGMIICFLFLSFFSGIVFYGAFKEYNDSKPQNQVKILKQKVSDAEKELQKYLIDHPELKEE